MKREAIRTSIPEIVHYWFSRIEEPGLSVDAAEAHERCWRCSCKHHLERCHIVPDAPGGKDEPSNLVLLCKRCHAENPNVADPEIMWDWIRSYGVPIYGTFWGIMGMKEYKFICKRSICEEIDALGITSAAEAGEEFRKITELVSRQASIHYGQPYFNTATVAGMYRMALKELARKTGRELECRHKSELNSQQIPWWTDV